MSTTVDDPTISEIARLNVYRALAEIHTGNERVKGKGYLPPEDALELAAQLLENMGRPGEARYYRNLLTADCC
jgi:hypothetical protein